MFKKMLVPLFVLITLVIGACAPQAAQSVSPAAQTATAIIQAAQDEQLVRNANATATAMAGGVVPNTEVVVQPTLVTESTPTPAQAPAQPETCKAINDYQLKDLTEISSQPSSLIHVEWYTADGQPEYESVLPSGRYTVDKPFPGGHVWEMSTSCTPNQVLSDHVAPHIARRLQNLANNKGFRPWGDLIDLGFITQVTSTSDVVVPNVLP